MWHLVCGDAAVAGVTFVLGQADADAGAGAVTGLRVMRDDLAVGPLHDIDTAPGAARAAFWQAVWPVAVQPAPDFTASLSADARWLAALPDQARAVTVWHGDSASEQLLLARVAAALVASDLPLWEVACGSGDSRQPHRRAVSMHRPEALLALQRPRVLEPSRRLHLAQQWQAAVTENAAIRRWRDGGFYGEDNGLIDAGLRAACNAEWRPLARAMAEVMAHCDGFFPSDFFLFWRARELSRTGRLQLSAAGDSQGYSTLSVRR